MPFGILSEGGGTVRYGGRDITSSAEIQRQPSPDKHQSPAEKSPSSCRRISRLVTCLSVILPTRTARGPCSAPGARRIARPADISGSNRFSDVATNCLPGRSWNATSSNLCSRRRPVAETYHNHAGRTGNEPSFSDGPASSGVFLPLPWNTNSSRDPYDGDRPAKTLLALLEPARLWAFQRRNRKVVFARKRLSGGSPLFAAETRSMASYGHFHKSIAAEILSGMPKAEAVLSEISGIGHGFEVLDEFRPHFRWNASNT